MDRVWSRPCIDLITHRSSPHHWVWWSSPYKLPYKSSVCHCSHNVRTNTVATLGNQQGVAITICDDYPRISLKGAQASGSSHLTVYGEYPPTLMLFGELSIQSVEKDVQRCHHTVITPTKLVTPDSRARVLQCLMSAETSTLLCKKNEQQWVYMSFQASEKQH